MISPGVIEKGLKGAGAVSPGSHQNVSALSQGGFGPRDVKRGVTRIVGKGQDFKREDTPGYMFDWIERTF